MLHHQTKKAIIAKYTPAPQESKEVVKNKIINQLKADEKEFEDSEIDSIIEEIFNQNPSSNNQPPAPQESKSVNRIYEEWRVEAKREDILDNADKKIGSKITGWEKLKLIRTTSISPDKAELLNSQSGNTNLRLFEVEA